MDGGLDTRSKIKEAALVLFVKKGVAETTVRDLANQAGIAEGTLYRHYAAKEDLIAELFREHYSTFGRRMEAVAAKATGFAAKLKAMVEDACRLFDEDPTLYGFLILNQHEALSRLPRGGEGPVRTVRTLMQAAIAAREATIADADLATALFLGMLVQPAMSMIHNGLKPPLSQYARRIADACQRTFVRQD